MLTGEFPCEEGVSAFLNSVVGEAEAKGNGASARPREETKEGPDAAVAETLLADQALEFSPVITRR